MRKPPEKPTFLRPQGTRITLPKPTLIIDSMEQRPYSFKLFRKWLAAIERKKLAAGDYSIAGLEERVVVPEMLLCGRVNAWANLILRLWLSKARSRRSCGVTNSAVCIPTPSLARSRPLQSGGESSPGLLLRAPWPKK